MGKMDCVEARYFAALLLSFSFLNIKCFRSYIFEGSILSVILVDSFRILKLSSIFILV